MKFQLKLWHIALNTTVMQIYVLLKKTVLKTADLQTLLILRTLSSDCCGCYYQSW